MQTAPLPPAIAAQLKPLASLVVKSGVMLGGLSELERQWVFAVASRRLDEGDAVNEAAANAALKAALAEELACLDIDHVELRRWLCDSGLWQRDGYGRAYQRTPTAALSTQRQALHHVLDQLGDLAHWCRLERDRVLALKAERHRAWLDQQARQAGAAPLASRGTPPN